MRACRGTSVEKAGHKHPVSPTSLGPRTWLLTATSTPHDRRMPPCSVTRAREPEFLERGPEAGCRDTSIAWEVVRMKILRPIPDLLNRNSWECIPKIRGLPGPPGNAEAHAAWRTAPYGASCTLVQRPRTSTELPLVQKQNNRKELEIT